VNVRQTGTVGVTYLSFPTLQEYNYGGLFSLALIKAEKGPAGSFIPDTRCTARDQSVTASGVHRRDESRRDLGGGEE
jgi:hypothetical protein